MPTPHKSSRQNRKTPPQSGAILAPESEKFAPESAPKSRHVVSGAGDIGISGGYWNVGQAATRLGLSASKVKQLAQSGELEAYKTDGGHWRISAASVEAMRQGNGDLQQSADRSHPQPSAIIRQKKERVEELNLTLQERKAKIALQELEAEQRQRAEQEDAEQRAREQEERRMRLAAEAERQRRQDERKEARWQEQANMLKREWQDEKVRLALNSLPADAPQELMLDVTEAVREKLEDLYQSAGHAEDVVDKVVLAIAEKQSRPWSHSKEAERAAQEAPKQLPIFARSLYGQAPTDWELRAKEQAIAAISKLPDAATFEQMSAAACAAGKRVGQEYEHSEKCRWSMIGVAGLLPYSSSPQVRAQAEEAVSLAFGDLPIGADSSKVDAARDAALAPFIRAEAEAKAGREAAEAEARAAREAAAEADLHLSRVNSYLGELEANPDGWNFEGKRYEYAEKIKEEIRADLIEDLPLDLAGGRKRVEELVDEWLLCRWQPSEDE